MRSMTASRRPRGTARRLAGALCGVAFAMALGTPSARSAASEWKKLEGDHKETPRAELLRLLKKEGVREAEELLKHPFLLRLEIRDAGGGSARHSEVVLRFRSQPRKVVAKAWTPGGQEPGRAQLGAFSECKEKPGAVGRSCPLLYNGRGFVDVTSHFTDRNILFIHDPARKSQGYTVLWFAADQSQKHLWYYVVPKATFPSFGFGRLTVKKYRVPKPEPLGRLPGDPPDPGTGPGPGPGPRPGPTPDPRPLPPPDRPVGPGPTPDPRPLPPPDASVTPRPGAWATVNEVHADQTRESLRRLMKAEGIAYPDHLLKHQYVARVALTDAGGGSRSRSELQLRLLSQPVKALGKAWADQPGLSRGQIGAEGLCQSLPSADGGPESKRCPMHFGGLGWRDVVTAFRSVRMRLVVDPNDNDSGHMVLWMAFEQPQTGMAYRLVERSTLPSLGGGKVSVTLYRITRGGAAPPPGPAPGTDWIALGGRPKSESRNALVARMRRDGVARPDHILALAYVVRLSISGAGGGEGRRSEAVVRFSSVPKAALGTAWGDHREGWGAQMGSLSRCRQLPRARNPYDDDSSGQRRPEGHVCPLQYNGLGWRNLVGGFGEPDVMFVTAPRRAGKGNQLLWLGFSEPPRLQLRPASPGGRVMARVVADTYSVSEGAPDSGPGPGPDPFSPPGHPRDPADNGQGGGPGPDPDPGPGPVPGAGWSDRSGTHLQVEKNALYWTVRRDGFENPWHLLKTRYLVRLEITGDGSQRAETLVRFSSTPKEAVGKGTGSNRSAMQAGTVEACRKTPGQPAFCPLHYAGIGWRNLVGSLGGSTLLFVTDPGRGGGGAPSTVLWLAFDTPEEKTAVQHSAGQGKATVKIQRFRW